MDDWPDALPDDLPDGVLADLLDDEEIVRPHRRTFRAIGALLLVGLLALLVLVPGGWLREHRDDGAAPPTTGPGVPTTTATLVGGPAGRSLSTADWRVQVGSTVLVGTTAPNCAGAITAVEGRRYVTSARHCLREAMDLGSVSDAPGRAEDVTHRLRRGLQVFDPTTHERLATLDRVAVGTGDQDVLLATTRAETPSFRSRPARSVERAPAVGDEVATYAAAGEVGFEPQRLTGVYLGPYPFHDDSGHAYTVDLIGYREPLSAAAVGPGHSGHASTGAGGTAFGPLLFSLNDATAPADRAAYLRDMGAATGIDVAGQNFAAVDEALRLTPGDYARLADAVRS